MSCRNADRKRCATCDRWSGPRMPAAAPGNVTIDSETVAGFCVGGPWDGSQRLARSACGRWVRWQALNNDTATDSDSDSTDSNTDTPPTGPDDH